MKGIFDANNIVCCSCQLLLPCPAFRGLDLFLLTVYIRNDLYI